MNILHIDKIDLIGGIEINSIIDDGKYDVEFMNLVVDKADNLRVTDCDSHFTRFTGVHYSKIKQGKLFLLDIIKPIYREEIMKALCKKECPYVYFNAEFIDKSKNEVLIHCTGQNFEDSSLCRLTLADLSRFEERQEKLRNKAKEMNYLIDLISGGVCLFKVTQDMHIETMYLNEGACKMFGTTKNTYQTQLHRLDELIHPQDKSLVFQAIGKAMATGTSIDIEFRSVVHKNEYKWCKVNAEMQSYDENNNPIFHAMLTDITSVKETEEQTDRYNDTLVELLKNIPDPVFFTDEDNVLELKIVSEDFIKFLGYTRAYLFEQHGGRLSDFMTEREVKYVEATIRNQLADSDVIKIRYSLRTKSGKFIVVEDKRKKVVDENGIVSLIGRLRNVTKKYEKEL